MKKRSLLVLAVAALGVVFLFAVVSATQQTPETITMQSAVFPEHTKGVVTFSHNKHNVDYKIACAECHHTYQDGKNVWKEGDEVKKCDTCHTGGKPEASETKGMSKEDKIKAYYFSAIHENCVGCHKALKKEAKPTGPTSCKECHPGEK
jgi:hypothetical protein